MTSPIEGVLFAINSLSPVDLNDVRNSNEFKSDANFNAYIEGHFRLIIEGMNKNHNGRKINEVQQKRHSPYQIMVMLEFYSDLSRDPSFKSKTPVNRCPESVLMLEFSRKLSRSRSSCCWGETWILSREVKSKITCKEVKLLVKK